MQDVGDAPRMGGLLLRGAAAPGEEAIECTGLWVGYGVFDALYTPIAEDAPIGRYGRGYLDKKRWTEQEDQDWQARFSGHRDEWGAQIMTVRLFKVIWQGQELSRESIVRVLQKVLEPFGTVQGNPAVYSKMFESRRVRPDEREKVLGTGGGIYLPVLMRNLANSDESQKKAQWLEMWSGVEPEGPEEL